RNVSHELNDESLKSNVGYITLVEALLNRQSEISKFRFKLTNDPGIAWETIAGSLKMNIYRILQEAIQNINKYAQARNVTVAFKQTGQDLELQIEDDGVGFEMSFKSKGIGIRNMRSRVAKLNGSITFDSAINGGTHILIKVPVEKQF
ncbi:MAG: two-component sensor histidine kinase, partial [Flavobacteriaceae bacterium]|nr:two-component sensor histidine kinase [Flavobacteriaceae bacterium]